MIIIGKLLQYDPPGDIEQYVQKLCHEMSPHRYRHIFFQVMIEVPVILPNQMKLFPEISQCNRKAVVQTSKLSDWLLTFINNLSKSVTEVP